MHDTGPTGNREAHGRNQDAGPAVGSRTRPVARAGCRPCAVWYQEAVAREHAALRAYLAV